MRVTNLIQQRSSVASLQLNLAGLERARADIASGVRLRRMSDAPGAAAEVVRVGSSMRALELFKRNLVIGRSKADAEDRVLDALTNALGRGLELAIGQASSATTAETRLAAKAEVDVLIDFVVRQGNTRVGDEYIFAGSRGGEAPFRNPPAAGGDFRNLLDQAGDPVDPSGSIPLEIGDGRFVVPNSTGTEIFLDTNALAALRSLSEALGANDVPAIRGSIDTLRDAVSGVQALVGRLGARMNDLDLARDQVSELELTLKAVRSDLRDTEIDKAMVELVGKQTLYQAAMAATSRVLGLSLANYL
jgi:flagellar hook-associated protein 3 FlgL